MKSSRSNTHLLKALRSNFSFNRCTQARNLGFKSKQTFPALNPPFDEGTLMFRERSIDPRAGLRGTARKPYVAFDNTKQATQLRVGVINHPELLVGGNCGISRRSGSPRGKPRVGGTSLSGRKQK